MTIESNINVQLLNKDARNEQFEKNLAFFKTNQPVIYQKIIHHNVTNYQICLNPDNSFNILNLQTHALLYPGTQEGQDQYCEVLLKGMKIEIDEHDGYLAHNKERQTLRSLHPLHSNLHQILYEQSHLPSHLDPDTGAIKISRNQINFLPILRVYGIGLGRHIIDALNSYDIHCMIIHEPEYDLFYCSLFTTPWDQILTHFRQDGQKAILLNYDPPKIAIDSEKAVLAKLHPFYYCGKAALNGFLDRDFQYYIDEEYRYDHQIFSNKVSGFYDDQARGFKHAIENINKKSLFYSGKKLPPQYPVFLIGSGPSLNDSLEYIKKNAQHAIIISCGSSLSVLTKNGILPDFHVWQERPDTSDTLSRFSDKSTFSKLTLFKLNVVSAEVDKIYNETLVLQKFNDPGSTLLPTLNFPSSYNVNPTVTNTGITICKYIGSKTVYMFGIDYGACEGTRVNHANGVTVISEDGKKILDNEQDRVETENVQILEGNFCARVYAKDALYWSHYITEIALAEKDARQIDWVNVGDGAKIKNARAIRASELPAFSSDALDKHEMKEKIRSLFNRRYSLKSIRNNLINVHIRASEAYLLAMMESFDTIPETRCAMMTTLGILANAGNVGREEESYLPIKLFGVEFVSFLNILYVQICSTQSDAEAVALYKNAIPVLQAHIEVIFKDFIDICSTLKGE